MLQETKQGSHPYSKEYGKKVILNTKPPQDTEVSKGVQKDRLGMAVGKEQIRPHASTWPHALAKPPNVSRVERIA